MECKKDLIFCLVVTIIALVAMYSLIQVFQMPLYDRIEELECEVGWIKEKMPWLGQH